MRSRAHVPSSMPPSVVLTVLALTAVTLAVQDEGGADPGPLIRLEVRADGGGAVEAAEAFLLRADGIPLVHAWKPVEQGRVAFARDDLELNPGADGPPARATVIVRAPGRAAHRETFDLPVAGPVAVALGPGRRVELVLRAPESVEIPATLEPVVYEREQASAAWLRASGWARGSEAARRVCSLAALERVDRNRFAFHVAPDVEALYVMISHPGFLRAFQAGPFERAELESGRVEIDLPDLGTLSASLAPADEAARPLPYEAATVVLYVNSGLEGGGFYQLELESEPSTSISRSWDDLAPGRYLVEVMTGSEAERFDFARPGFFRESRSFEVAAGATESMAVEFMEFDKAAALAKLRGDYSVTVTVTRQDGTPAAEQAYELKRYEPQAANQQLVAASGVTDANGRALLENLAGGEDAPYLTLHVDGVRVAPVHLTGDETDRDMDVKLPPRAGDSAPDLVLRDVFADATVTLSDYSGQVLFVDFWATWCGPCQQPMQHNSDILARRATDWDGRAAIVAVSIDQSPEIVARHCKGLGWDNVPQLWCSEGEPGWNSVGAKTYGITGVPTAFLIGADGTILWRGHPGSFDVEAEIDEALEAPE